MRSLLFIAACAGIVIAPFLFESYTFYRYTISEPDFFVFSGARLWFFLASELSLGFVAGRISKLPPFTSAGCLGVAIAILILLLYRICDERQCYYPGPDGASWLRLYVLLFAVASTGLLQGRKSRREPENKSGVSAVLFGSTTLIFLGYYPTALLFDMFLRFPLAFGLLAFASSVPFFFAGVSSTMFSSRRMHALFSAIIGWAALSALFVSLRPEAASFLAVIIITGIPIVLLSHKVSKRLRKELVIATSFSSMITLFALLAVHPLLDSPMNLAISDAGAIVQPTYYAGAYHFAPHFPTKKVEVGIDLGSFDDTALSKSDFVLAGMGVQSPNCCKDGLDYGYRSDLLFADGARYLVARAWATCDQNMGCSAFPWIYVMHYSTVRLSDDSSHIMLAMEWNGKTVDWSYKTGSTWSRYSSFVPPKIENPYFNLGVIWVGSPTANPDLQNACFYQVGVSIPSKETRYGQITFECPSYFDKEDTKQCISPAKIVGGNSHWKVLWKWGLPDDKAKVLVNETNITVGSR